jgi:hypothetical protein
VRTATCDLALEFPDSGLGIVRMQWEGGPDKEAPEESVFRQLLGRGGDRKRIRDWPTTGGINWVNVQSLMADGKSRTRAYSNGVALTRSYSACSLVAVMHRSISLFAFLVVR